MSKLARQGLEGADAGEMGLPTNLLDRRASVLDCASTNHPTICCGHIGQVGRQPVSSSTLASEPSDESPAMQQAFRQHLSESLNHSQHW